MAVAALFLIPGTELREIRSFHLVFWCVIQCAAQETPRDVIQMNADDALRIVESKRNRDRRPPVAALCGETHIPEFLHQSRPQFRDLLGIHSSHPRSVRESIAWQRWHNH